MNALGQSEDERTKWRPKAKMRAQEQNEGSQVEMKVYAQNEGLEPK